MNTLPSKDPNEVVPLTFDFSEYLTGGEALTGTPTITVETYSGVDATPANLIYGSPTVTGDRIKQAVRLGVDGVTYLVRASSTTTAGNVYALGALLPVKRAGL